MSIPLPPRAPRKETETDLVYLIIQAIGRLPGVRSSRNNVGSIRDARGIPVTFGLGDGSPDIVGVITFGGKNTTHATLRGVLPIALAFGLEVKRPREDGGKAATRDQRAWHHVAERRGFPVRVVRTPEEGVEAVRAMRAGMIARLVDVGGAFA